jgi:signal transduction histidine kinase
MDSRTACALPRLAWVRADEAEYLTFPRSDGGTQTCRVVPSLGDALAAAREHGEPVPITLRDGEGRETPGLLVPVPHPAALALVIETAEGRGATSEALEGLVNQIAHDVRNFAFTIGLQAEMGARRSEDALAGGHFDAVLRQVDKLKAYLEALLLFGRPARLEPVPFELAAFIREQVQRWHARWSGETLPLSVIVEGEPGLVRWDRQAMAPVLQAILDNAAQSATPPPAVEIHASGERHRVTIRICDRGDGIPPEMMARLETPMAARRAGGAGLGLAIARKMVRAHGGFLSVASAEGGTTVLLSLPREVPAG